MGNNNSNNNTNSNNILLWSPTMPFGLEAVCWDLMRTELEGYEYAVESIQLAWNNEARTEICSLAEYKTIEYL